jgi:hypothetical protein
MTALGSLSCIEPCHCCLQRRSDNHLLELLGLAGTMLYSCKSLAQPRRGNSKPLGSLFPWAVVLCAAQDAAFHAFCPAPYNSESQQRIKPHLGSQTLCFDVAQPLAACPRGAAVPANQRCRRRQRWLRARRRSCIVALLLSPATSQRQGYPKVSSNSLPARCCGSRHIANHWHTVAATRRHRR